MSFGHETLHSVAGQGDGEIATSAEHALTEWRQPVVPTALIVVANGPFGQLLRQSLVDELLEGAVQCRRSHSDQPAGRTLDILHDRVTVPLTSGEGDEDVELYINT